MKKYFTEEQVIGFLKQVEAGLPVEELLEQIQVELVELKKAPKAAKPPTKLVTYDEIEAFGEDLVDVQRRIAQEVVMPMSERIDALESENQSLREQLGNTGSQMANLSFEQRLSMRVPDFEKVNADPQWVAWLDEIDPMIRGPRRSMAQAAYANGDVDAVAYYVDMFRKATAPAERAPSTKEAELRSQVAPSRTVSTSSQADKGADTKVYTEAEASDMFDKVATLNRQGKYGEATKLEIEVTAAYNSGRVR